MIVSRDFLEIATDGGSIELPARGARERPARRRPIDVAITSGVGDESPSDPRSPPVTPGC